MSVLNKKGNKIMTTNFNFAKMRCRKLAWMLEDWPSWLFLVDAFSNLNPRVAIGAPFFIRCSKTNELGHWTRAQGPPHG